MYTILLNLVTAQAINITAIRQLLEKEKFSSTELAKVMIEYLDSIFDEFRTFCESVGYCSNVFKYYMEKIENLRSFKALALFKLFYRYGMDLSYSENGESIICKCVDIDFPGMSSAILAFCVKNGANISDVNVFHDSMPDVVAERIVANLTSMSYEEELQFLFPLLISAVGLSDIAEHWSISPVKEFDIRDFKDYDKYSFEPYGNDYFVKYRFFKKINHEIVAYFKY